MNLDVRFIGEQLQAGAEMTVARQIAAEAQLTEDGIQDRMQRALERLRKCSPAQLQLVPDPDRVAA